MSQQNVRHHTVYGVWRKHDWHCAFVKTGFIFCQKQVGTRQCHFPAPAGNSLKGLSFLGPCSTRVEKPYISLGNFSWSRDFSTELFLIKKNYKILLRKVIYLSKCKQEKKKKRRGNWARKAISGTLLNESHGNTRKVKAAPSEEENHFLLNELLRTVLLTRSFLQVKQNGDSAMQFTKSQWLQDSGCSRTYLMTLLFCSVVLPEPHWPVMSILSRVSSCANCTPLQAPMVLPRTINLSAVLAFAYLCLSAVGSLTVSPHTALFSAHCCWAGGSVSSPFLTMRQGNRATPGPAKDLLWDLRPWLEFLGRVYWPRRWCLHSKTLSGAVRINWATNNPEAATQQAWKSY